MHKIHFFRLVTALLILLNIFFIFRFSAQKATVSAASSKKVTEKVLEITVPDFEKKPEPVRKNMIKKADSTVRTLAHFSEYTALGFLLAAHLSLYKISKLKSASFALSGCALHAIADEIHQIYVPGRSFQFSDIATDTLGSLLGVLLFTAILILVLKFSKKKTAVT